jgi:hypothetical protein
MTAEQLIIGNKYLPFQKTAGESFEDSFFIRNNYDFLYYRGIDPSSHRHTFGSSERGSGGGFYNPEDVYEYIESYNDIIFRGSKVRIANSGGTYTTFAKMFERLGFANKESNDSWFIGTQGEVFGITHAEDRCINRILLAIRDEFGNECLINAFDVDLAEQTQEQAFVLPDKWQIEITPDNADMLIDWRGLTITSRDDNAYMLCDVPNGRHASVTRGFVNTTKRQDYTEITTEQFIQYVLYQTPTDMPTQEQTPQTETKQYPKRPEGLYAMTMDMLNLKVGDIVKVTHKTPNHYMGWQNSWCVDMDAMIGNEYEVNRISDNRNGISLVGKPFNFPPYSLEFVRKGGQELTYHIGDTIGRLKYGADEWVKFDQPVTELAASDIYWLAKLFVGQNRKDDIRIASL